MKTIYEMCAADLRVIAREYNMPGAWKARRTEMIAYLESKGYHEPTEKEQFTDELKLQNDPKQTQDDSELIEEPKSNKLSDKNKKPLKPASGLRGYAAWVVDRKTKEITTIIDEAKSREEFYNSIKDQYRVRLITKPEKITEECKQWEIRHAQNKIKKNEKYAADKEEAKKLKMTVAEYRKKVKISQDKST